MPRVLVVVPHSAEGLALVTALRDELAADAWGRGRAFAVAIDLATDAHEALGLLQTIRYEVLVLDVDMPRAPNLAPVASRVVLLGTRVAALAHAAVRFDAGAVLVRPVSTLAICAIVGMWIAMNAEAGRTGAQP